MPHVAYAKSWKSCSRKRMIKLAKDPKVHSRLRVMLEGWIVFLSSEDVQEKLFFAQSSLQGFAGLKADDNERVKLNKEVPEPELTPDDKARRIINEVAKHVEELHASKTNSSSPSGA